MRLKFNDFVNVKDIDIEFNNKLNILVADNGTGKTLLLEAYSKMNDYILSKLRERKNFISDLVDRFEYNVHFFNSNESDSYSVQLKLTNIEELSKMFLQSMEKLKKELEQIVYKEILYSRMDMELILDFGNFKNYVNDIEYLELGVENFLGEDFLLSLFIKEFEDSDKELVYSDFIDASKVIEIKRAISEESKELLKNYFELFLSKVISERFLSQNNIKKILYIPSERAFSMSRNLEKLTSSGDFLRYSEQKFMKDYQDYKEFIRIKKFFDEDIEFSAIFENLIGGELQFKDGDVVSLIDVKGVDILRELFSTKQNKLHSLSMLEYNRDPGLLIIEEPEANLSIKSILEMFEYLKYLSLKYTIVIATHSDIMLTLINNWYLDNPNKNSIGGWEILDVSENSESKKHFVFKQLEMTDYGLNSEFMTEQLEILHDITLKSQNNL